jgi:hypothetical protein
MKPRFMFGVALLALVAVILAACGGATASPRSQVTTPSTQSRTVQVTITNGRMDMSQTTFSRGVRYTFMVANHGPLRQECMITAHPMGEVPMDQAPRKAMMTTSEMMPGSTQAFEYTFSPSMTPQKLWLNCYSQGQVNVGMHLELQ